jgi:hypothetical protein
VCVIFCHAGGVASNHHIFKVSLSNKIYTWALLEQSNFKEHLPFSLFNFIQGKSHDNINGESQGGLSDTGSIPFQTLGPPSKATASNL